MRGIYKFSPWWVSFHKKRSWHQLDAEESKCLDLRRSWYIWICEGVAISRFAEELIYLDLMCPCMSCLCNLFAIVIFIFITVNQIISLIQTNLLFGHVCQKFSLRVLLSFCLIFYQFQPGNAYKSVTYKKSMYLDLLSIS